MTLPGFSLKMPGMALPRILNFISQTWLEPLNKQYLPVVNPSTGEIISELADSSFEDINRAVVHAKLAFPSWAGLSAGQRSAYLHQIANNIESRAREFAEVESQDQGKPVWLARDLDIPRAVSNFRFFAQFILDAEKEREQYDEKSFTSQVSRKPVGVVGLISPWNLPLYLLTWKIAPAIAFGNTVVAKPSELTSLTAALLAEVIQQTQLPPGVVNFVFGTGVKVGEALVKHPDVPLISFTGGTETGRRIYRESAEHFKKLSLELGGKNPTLIFSDVNLAETVTGVIRSSFLNQGEICLCGSRIYVEDGIYDAFLEGFVAQVQQLKVGDPKDPESFVGALVSEAHLQKVLSYVDIARKEGGKIHCGGARLTMPGDLAGGFFMAPTVISELPESSKCIQEEIFGPVVTVSRFSDAEEAVEKANGVRYGLSASIWSADEERAQRLAERLDVGTVWINSWLLRDLRVPFGGMKHSGLGREGGHYSRDFFTEPTTIVRKRDLGEQT